jgi:hypothetical protein
MREKLLQEKYKIEQKIDEIDKEEIINWLINEWGIFQGTHQNLGCKTKDDTPILFDRNSVLTLEKLADIIIDFRDNGLNKNKIS